MTATLAFPVYNRPHYLSQVLKSWQDVRGAGDAVAVYRCEPGQPEVEDLVRDEFPFAAGAVYVNERQLGNDQNMLAALTTAFGTGADFVIAAEDDVMVAADLIEYMLAMRDAYAGDKTILAVMALQKNPPGPLDEVHRREDDPKFLGGNCWGIWRDRWDEVAPSWPPSGSGYDRHLWTHCDRTGRTCIEPLATRCKDIGEYGVTTIGDWASFGAVWERQQFTADIPPQVYREA